LYTPEARESAAALERRGRVPARPDPPLGEALWALLGHPQVASQRWVYEQYDSTVRAGTAVGPGGDGGVIAIPGTSRGIAVATDGNSRYVLLDPYEGGKAAVAEAARNVACVGARPIGITNCLNFGSPERPEIFFQFREACRGIADACRALDTPVTGGNVSFYNESPLGAVDPTPVIGMVGLIDDVERVVRVPFVEAGDVILLLGDGPGHLGGSAYWALVLGETVGPPPPVELGAERRLIDLLATLTADGLLRSAHDVSEGGLAVALVEAAIGRPYVEEPRGARVDLRALAPGTSAAARLFGEDHGRVLVTVAPANANRVTSAAGAHGVAAHPLGQVGEVGEALVVDVGGEVLRLDVSALRNAYDAALPARMRLAAAGVAEG
jgi:phosphoribosylformylglycinamidine synthase